MKYNPTDIARQFLYVREAAPNAGQKVEAIQKWGGGQKGESWCCYATTMVLDICFQGKAPIPRLGACQDVYEMAKKQTNGVRLLADDEAPQKDDIYLFVDDNNHAHHIGIVTIDGGSTGIAGNTSPDGKSSNGDGWYEHGISTNRARVKYVRYPKQ